jgi:hypothetical protein
MVGWVPGIVFEAAIGGWLLLKGIRAAPVGVATPAAAPAATAGGVR